MIRFHATVHVLLGLSLSVISNLTVIAQELPAGTLVLSKVHPNKELIDAGFQPVEAKLGESWQQILGPDVTYPAYISGFVVRDNLYLMTHSRDDSAKIWLLDENNHWSEETRPAYSNGLSQIEYDEKLWRISYDPFGVCYTLDGGKETFITNNIPWLQFAPQTEQPQKSRFGLQEQRRLPVPQLLKHNDSLLSIGQGKVWRWQADEWNCVSETPSLDAAVSYRGCVYIIGNQQNADSGKDSRRGLCVWSSTDGNEWQLLNDNAFDANLKSFELIVAEGKMWILGGSAGSGLLTFYNNDVWCSDNGKEWYEVPSKGNKWDPRAFPSKSGCNVFAVRGRIYILGGYEGKGITWGRNGGIWVTTPVIMNQDGFYYYEKQ